MTVRKSPYPVRDYSTKCSTYFQAVEQLLLLCNKMPKYLALHRKNYFVHVEILALFRSCV